MGRLCVSLEGWTQRVVSDVAHCKSHTFLGANTHQAGLYNMWIYWGHLLNLICSSSALLNIHLKNLQFNIREHLIQKQMEKKTQYFESFVKAAKHRSHNYAKALLELYAEARARASSMYMNCILSSSAGPISLAHGTARHLHTHKERDTRGHPQATLMQKRPDWPWLWRCMQSFKRENRACSFFEKLQWWWETPIATPSQSVFPSVPGRFASTGGLRVGEG